eukprot:5779018-Amphidinium_carterae.1
MASSLRVLCMHSTHCAPLLSLPTLMTCRCTWKHLLSVWDHHADGHRRVQLSSATVDELLTHVQPRGRRLLYTDPDTQQVFGIDKVGPIRRFTVDSIKDYTCDGVEVRVRLAPLVNAALHTKVLGFHFSQQFMKAEHVDHICRIHSQRRSVVRLLASSSWGPDTCTLSQVANGFVQSACSLHMFMIIGIGSAAQLQRVRRLDTALSRLVTGCPAGSSARITVQESGIVPLELRGFQQAWQLLQHSHKFPDAHPFVQSCLLNLQVFNTRQGDGWLQLIRRSVKSACGEVPFQHLDVLRVVRPLWNCQVHVVPFASVERFPKDERKEVHKKHFEFHFAMHKEYCDSVLWTDGSNTSEVSRSGFMLTDARGNALETDGAA